MAKSIPHAVGEKLGFYVYLYVNPFDKRIFYLGKGQHGRATAHLEDTSESRKAEMIRKIRSNGKEPEIELLVHGLKTEEEALRIEAAAIDLLGLDTLTNQVSGVESARMSLDQAVDLYTAEDAHIDDPCILIRINRLFRFSMTEEELYHTTRGVWKVGPRRCKAKYALAIFRGVVREAYRIEEWVTAKSTFYPAGIHRDAEYPGRWEFVGVKAEEAIRSKYCGKNVEAYLPKGSQNPIKYVNC